jgi:hypothetical protein
MKFRIIGKIEKQETIATGLRIREIERLKKVYGDGKWRKMKGIAKIEMDDHSLFSAEIHWYEAHGKGKKEYKIKRFLD